MNNNYQNPEYMNYLEARQHAERLVKAKIGFYWHLAVYSIINGLLIVLYLLTSWEMGSFYYPWFLWPLVGWGVGLFFNFMAVFVFPNTPQSRQRMVDNELERMGINTRFSTSVYPPAAPQPKINSPADSSNSNHLSLR